jgi:hypothetical protein
MSGPDSARSPENPDDRVHLPQQPGQAPVTIAGEARIVGADALLAYPSRAKGR